LAASVLPLLPLILVAGLAATIGESMAYLLGDGIESLIGDAKWHKRLKSLFLKAPFIFLVIWIALPNPIQTLGQVFAGSVKYPFGKYILATMLGNLIWYTSVAMSGYWAAGLIR
jgi:membrane protein DedA with SNARE-associated domain